MLFGTGFDYALARSFIVDGREIEYTSYLLPDVIAMTAFSVAMNTSWGFSRCASPCSRPARP